MRVNKLKRKNAMTLIEMVFAIAAGALLVACLAGVLKILWMSWKQYDSKSELIQHARIAMARITEELKYTENLDGLPLTASFRVDTLYLPSGPGKIQYRVLNSVLNRTEQLTTSVIAGSVDEGIYVTGLEAVPMKLENGNLVEFVPGDTPGDAVALLVNLTVENANGDSITVSSMAKFRNTT